MSQERTIATGTTQNEITELHNSTQHYEVLMELADCLTSVGKYDQARQHYEKAAVLDPDAAGPYVGLGVVALQKSSLDDAEIAFRVACRLEPDCARAYAGQAMVAQQRAHYTEAFQMYLKCLGLENDNLTALLGLFQTSCQMGSFEKIIHYLQVYLDMHPGDTSVMFALAALYVKDGRDAESRKILRDVLVLQPEHKEAANLLEEVERGLAEREQSKVAGR
ncbi:MAG: tetratricopeptide repeat protein [Sedimentisphaerales bacterium]|nr:tetratricopeptide repeat protein [Sedimentisphaerales bacterium]